MAGTGTVTVDFGATPIDSGTFNVVDAGVTGASYVEAWVMVDTTVTNDADAHKVAAASFRLSCEALAGSFDLTIDCLFGLVTDEFDIRYVFTP